MVCIALELINAPLRSTAVEAQENQNFRISGLRPLAKFWRRRPNKIFQFLAGIG